MNFFDFMQQISLFAKLLGSGCEPLTLQQTEELECLLEPTGIDTVRATISNDLKDEMHDAFSKKESSWREAGANEKMHSKMCEHCVRFSRDGNSVKARKRMHSEVCEQFGR